MQKTVRQQEEMCQIKLQTEKEQLQTTTAIWKKVEAERELAELQLRKFKKENEL